MSSRSETTSGAVVARPAPSAPRDLERRRRGAASVAGQEATLSAAPPVPVPVGRARPFPETFPVERMVGHERWVVPVLRWVNTRLWAKRIAYWYMKWTSRAWMTAVTSRLWNHYGLEHVVTARPTRGILLVGNHRSFFDMYVAMIVLWRYTKLVDHLYFPVRANFFYEGPLGAALNLGIAGGSMWPPVFRDPERRFELNPTGLEQMAWALNRPGALMGMHPEGTRGRGPDPHVIAPAKRGVGELLKRCDDELMIIPFFVGGMTNDILYEIKRNFAGPERRGHGIRFSFGEPRLAGDIDRSRDGKELAEEMLDWVRELAAQDKARVSEPVPDEGIGIPVVDRRIAKWKAEQG